MLPGNTDVTIKTTIVLFFGICANVPYRQQSDNLFRFGSSENGLGTFSRILFYKILSVS